MKTCSATVGCHGASPAIAGFTLTPDVLTQHYDRLLDQPNVGLQEIKTSNDPNGCPPGRYKLIDSSDPTNSLIYRKAQPKPFGSAPALCGSFMPVLGAFTDADKACVLRWIQSVIAASR